MLISNDDAFRNNACKKAAQLGRVIFTLNANALDRDIECHNISVLCEQNEILPLFHEHQIAFKSIQQSLLEYRKQCIQKVKREYAPLYKQLKSTFSSSILQATQQVNNIFAEIEDIQSQLSQLQTDPSSTIKFIDKLFTELKKPRPKVKVKELDLRQIKIDSDARIEKMYHEFQQQKKQLQNELAQVVPSIYKAKKEEFVELYKTIFQLKNEIGQKKTELSNVLSKHQSAMTTFQNFVSDFKTSLSSEIKTLTQQKLKLSSAPVSGDRSKQSLLNKHKQRITKLQKEISLVQQLFQQQKIKTSHLESSLYDEKRRQHIALKSIERDSEAKMKEEENQVRKDFENAKRILQTRENDYLQLRIWCDANNARTMLPNRKCPITIRHSDISNLDKLVKSQKTALVKEKEKGDKFIKKLQTELNTLNTRQKNEIAQVKKQNKAQIDADQTKYTDVLNQRRKELDDYLNKKQKMYLIEEKQMQKEKEEETRDRISDLEKFRSRPLKKTISSQVDNSCEVKLEQLKSMNQFISAKLEELQQVLAEKMKVVMPEIEEVEKRRRLIERKIEEEKQQINAKYEQELNNIQLSFRQSIDNLGKIYDADENEQSRVLSEAKHHLFLTNQQTDEEIHRLQNDLAQLRISSFSQEYLTQAQQILTREKYRAQKEVDEIRSQIEANQTKFEIQKQQLLKEKEAILIPNVLKAEKPKKEIEFPQPPEHQFDKLAKRRAAIEARYQELSRKKKEELEAFLHDTMEQVVTFEEQTTLENPQKLLTLIGEIKKIGWSLSSIENSILHLLEE